MTGVALTAACIGASPLYAQTPPDAGMLRQQIERDLPPLLPRPATPEKPSAPPAMQPANGVVVTVKTFRFSGNTLLSDSQLTSVVEPYLGRPLAFNQLQAAAAAVADAYRVAGWLVRAYLPKQEIIDGVVTIQIVEAVFGGARLDGAGSARIPTERLLRWFEARQTRGAALNIDDLDRALLLVDELPGVNVSGNMRQGSNDRETEMVLKVTDRPVLAGEAMLDNTGSRSTGSKRFMTNIAINSPLHSGDLFNGTLLHTEGSDYARVGVSAPCGYDGLRLGSNASYMKYRLVTPEFAALKGLGDSATFGLDANYALVRKRMKNLYLSLALDHKTFDNESGGATTSNYKVDVLSLGLSGNLFDNFGGGGANSASLNLALGRTNLSGSPNEAADAASTRTAGRYARLRYAISRQQVLTTTLSLYGSFSGQIASKNLDSSEKFTLGGASGVRAYPGSEGSGAEGTMVNLELRWNAASGIMLTAFIDRGTITVNRNNEFTGAAIINRYSLSGSGLAIAWRNPAGWQLKGVLARRLGNNPNPAANGNDQDGSLIRNRAWLTASLSF